MMAVIVVDSKLIDDDAQILKLRGRSDHISGAATNFVREGQSLMSSGFNFYLLCVKMISMSQLHFWSIRTGYDVKYLLLVGIEQMKLI